MTERDMGNGCESKENSNKKKNFSSYYDYSDINTYYKEKKVYNTYGVI